MLSQKVHRNFADFCIFAKLERKLFPWSFLKIYKCRYKIIIFVRKWLYKNCPPPTSPFAAWNNLEVNVNCVRSQIYICLSLGQGPVYIYVRYLYVLHSRSRRKASIFARAPYSICLRSFWLSRTVSNYPPMLAQLFSSVWSFARYSVTRGLKWPTKIEKSYGGCSFLCVNVSPVAWTSFMEA
jgi:hypothetical protein